MSVQIKKDITTVQVEVPKTNIAIENSITQVSVQTSTPQITISSVGISGKDGTHGTSGISSDGFPFSGSAQITGSLLVTGSIFLNGTDITSIVGNGGSGTSGTSGFSIDSGSFVITSSFNSLTSSIQLLSESFDLRISQATNEQDLSYLATTGSNTFIGNQILSGTLYFNDDYNSTQAAMGMFQAVSGSGFPLFDNISKDFGIISATSDITLVTLLNNAPPNTLTDVAQVSLTRSGSLDVYANMNVSGSIIPATANGTFTSSFSLGSVTNAWKDLYISHGSIIFVDEVTQATSSFKIAANNEVQYSNGITASYYEGDGSRLTNLPSTTNWKTFTPLTLRNTEQLTFSGDYILEDAYLLIEGGDYEVEYSPNKSFKKEGSLFIGGNLLVKDSTIVNNGKISVGGEVILIGSSQIIGTGTII